MANASNRFYGEVGYAPTITDEYGVSRVSIVKRNYYGDVIRPGSRWQSGEKVNDDISVNNQISIIADPYAIRNFIYIKYVNWMGIDWEVSTIKVEYPRIVLTLGGVYNGNKT